MSDPNETPGLAEARQAIALFKALHVSLAQAKIPADVDYLYSQIDNCDARDPEHLEAALSEVDRLTAALSRLCADVDRAARGDREGRVPDAPRVTVLGALSSVKALRISAVEMERYALRPRPYLVSEAGEEGAYAVESAGGRAALEAARPLIGAGPDDDLSGYTVRAVTVADVDAWRREIDELRAELNEARMDRAAMTTPEGCAGVVSAEVAEELERLQARVAELEARPTWEGGVRAALDVIRAVGLSHFLTIADAETAILALLEPKP